MTLVDREPNCVFCLSEPDRTGACDFHKGRTQRRRDRNLLWLLVILFLASVVALVLVKAFGGAA